MENTIFFLIALTPYKRYYLSQFSKSDIGERFFRGRKLNWNVSKFPVFRSNKLYWVAKCRVKLYDKKDGSFEVYWIKLIFLELRLLRKALFACFSERQTLSEPFSMLENLLRRLDIFHWSIWSDQIFFGALKNLIRNSMGYWFD